MPKQTTTTGAEALVREGEAAFAEMCDLIAGHGPLPCSVEHKGAGGQCERNATMEVYGLAFCESHGAEAKAGALEELYYDAAAYLERLDNPHVPDPNREALRVLRAGVGKLDGLCLKAGDETEELLKRAYPYREDLVEPDTLAFDYDKERGVSTPYDRYRNHRHNIHRLMRLAFEMGEGWCVEWLETEREYVAAQAAYALVDLERRAPSPMV